MSNIDSASRVSREQFDTWSASAVMGDMKSQICLAKCYSTGNGCPQNTEKGIELYKLAANQGSAEAQYNVANHYYELRKVRKYTPKESQEIVVWFQRAADQRHALAMASLGKCYLDGFSVNPDNVVAYMWNHLCAINGGRPTNFDEVTREMTRDEIAEAEELANDWLPVSMIRSQMRGNARIHEEKPIISSIRVIGRCNEILALSLMCEAVFAQWCKGENGVDVTLYIAHNLEIEDEERQEMLLGFAMKIRTALASCNGDINASLLRFSEGPERERARLPLDSCKRVAQEFKIPWTQQVGKNKSIFICVGCGAQNSSTNLHDGGGACEYCGRQCQG